MPVYAPSMLPQYIDCISRGHMYPLYHPRGLELGQALAVAAAAAEAERIRRSFASSLVVFLFNR